MLTTTQQSARNLTLPHVLPCNRPKGCPELAQSPYGRGKKTESSLDDGEGGSSGVKWEHAQGGRGSAAAGDDAGHSPVLGATGALWTAFYVGVGGRGGGGEVGPLPGGPGWPGCPRSRGTRGGRGITRHVASSLATPARGCGRPNKMIHL